MFNKIGFIGAGAVGKTFGKFLYLKSNSLVGYYSRDFRDSKSASEDVKGKAYNQLIDLVVDCDCIAITVNDDAIDSVVESILSLEVDLKKKFIFHTSGAHSSKLLEPLEKNGAMVCSIHPLQSFASGDFSMEHLQGMYCALEGSHSHKAQKWLAHLELKFILLSASQKKSYHMAAVMVSNFMVPLIGEGVEIFKSFGLTSSEAFEALKPLINGTLSNIENKGVENALTGPYARGDLSTVKTHLSMSEAPEVKHFYMECAAHTLRFIEKTHGLTPAQDEIRTLLQEVKHEKSNR